MSNLSKKFATSEKKELEGIEVHFPDDVVFVVRRAGGRNVAFNTAVELKTEPYKSAIKRNLLDQKLVARLGMEAFVETCIVFEKCRGLKEDDGTPIEFNAENVLKEFDKSPDVADILFEEASRAANYRDKALEDTGKNSPAP